MKLSIRVTPRAKKNAVKYKEGLWRVYVTAPPVDGKANSAVIDLLVKTFDLRRSEIHIISGHLVRDKELVIDNPSQKLLQLMRDQAVLL